VRIDWEKQQSGNMPEKVVTALNVRKDFTDRLYAGEVDDLAGYREYLQSIHHLLSAYITPYILSLKTAETEYFYSMSKNKTEPKAMTALLDEYLATLSPHDEGEGEEIIQKISKQQENEVREHGKYNPYCDVLHAFADLFLIGTEKKRRSILCYGNSNSGKTSLGRIFKEIFDGFAFRSAEKYAVQMRRRDCNPSLVVEDEWDGRNLNKGKIEDTKRLLEGSGSVIEQKYVDPVLAF